MDMCIHWARKGRTRTASALANMVIRMERGKGVNLGENERRDESMGKKKREKRAETVRRSPAMLISDLCLCDAMVTEKIR